MSMADMGAIFLNTPDPMMMPATIKIAVVKPRARMSGILDSSILDSSIVMSAVILVLVCMFDRCQYVPDKLQTFHIKWHFKIVEIKSDCAGRHGIGLLYAK